MSAADNVNDLGERPAGFVWRRALIGLVVLTVALLGVGAVWQWLGGNSAGQFQGLLDRLDQTDPKWRLRDIEEARPEPPSTSNSAVVVTSTVGLLGRGWPSRGFDEQFQDVDRVPTARLDAEQAALLEKELAGRAAALAEARKLADLPHGRHRLVIAEEPVNTLLNDQQNTRQVATLLAYDALLRAHKQDVGGALTSCRAGLNAARSLGDEPFIISQLIRIACIAVACDKVERALAQGEAGEADLLAVQDLLAREERHPTLLVALRGERALLNEQFDRLRDGKVKLNHLLGPGGGEADWKTRLFGLSKQTIRREQGRTLELMTRLVEAARLPEHEQREALDQVEADLHALPREAFLTRLVVPAVSKAGEACRRKKAQVRCLMVLLAVERYRLKKGAWPGKLEEVVAAGLLASVPLDPYDGKPLRYVKRGDGVTVYSIGPDKADNGGTIDRSRPLDPGVDQGYRLWDVKGRRQPPVPRPKPVPPAWHPGMGGAMGPPPGTAPPGSAPPPAPPAGRK